MYRLSKTNRNWQISKMYLWERAGWTGNEGILMRREGNSPWIADICCPERALFPAASEQTWKAHIPRGIVGASVTMAAWACIAPFMEGFKPFHFWEAGSITLGFLQTLNYTLRQNDLASRWATPRAGKVNPDQYKWSSGLVPYFWQPCS